MKIREYNNPDRYASPASMKHMINRQREMLMRHYADYKDGQYVLWLVPELFFNFSSLEISGEIAILTKTGAKMDIPFLVRNPYPNKCIYQLSMKSGRKRLYGIPLVFDSFEKLCEVSEIRIQWNIFHSIYLTDQALKPFMICLDQINVRYFISFTGDSKERYYTLYTRDKIPEVAESLEEANEYYKEFTLALEYDHNALYGKEGLIEDMLVEVSSLKEIQGEGERLAKREAEIRGFLKEVNVPHQTVMEYLHDDLEKIEPLEMNYYQHYYENSVILTPAAAADIDTASCFGFAEI